MSHNDTNEQEGVIGLGLGLGAAEEGKGKAVCHRSQRDGRMRASKNRG